MTTSAATVRPAGAAKPKGDEVMPAIINAATELFSERGPAATAIREIAIRARVNHGLVFRYFGTKEQLVGAVLDHLGQRLFDLISADAPVSQVDAAIDLQSRVVARATLDGYSTGTLQTTFPGIALLIEDIQDQHPTELDARLAAANAVALQLSWRLFGPYLRASAGLDHISDKRLQSSITDAAARVGAAKPTRTRRRKGT